MFPRTYPSLGSSLSSDGLLGVVWPSPTNMGIPKTGHIRGMTISLTDMPNDIPFAAALCFALRHILFSGEEIWEDLRIWRMCSLFNL